MRLGMPLDGKAAPVEFSYSQMIPESVVGSRSGSCILCRGAASAVR